jgi:hypothetical protein
MPDRRSRVLVAPVSLRRNQKECRMAERGVLYIIWGGEAEAAMQRSLASLNEIHPELPHHIVRLPPREHPLENILEKSKMMSLSPFAETLFLDADTIVLGRLDYGFEQAARFGLAVALCEAPFGRRYPTLPQDDAVEYNTGVVFFTRKAEAVFRRWEELSPQIDSSLPFANELGSGLQQYNDQCAFVRAVAEWDRAPFVLPLNWNFRPGFYWTWFGPIKIWHGYEPVPPSIMKIMQIYRQPGAMLKFHAPTITPK